MNIIRNQDILNEMEKAWNAVAQIEKATGEMLNEGDPILEIIGFAFVHMMNACQEIEEKLGHRAEKAPQTKTFAQIIDVLTRIKWTGIRDQKGLIEAYQEAVRGVAKFNCIHRNAIDDACTRRLQLNRDGFLALVERWLSGNSKELERTLLWNFSVYEHRLIQDFFQKKGGFRERL
jgi:hypothetical protein